MPGEEDGDEGEAEDEANVILPDPPGTLTTPGGLLFTPLLESRFGNLLPGCTPATGEELQYMVESTLVGGPMVPVSWLVVVPEELYLVRLAADCSNNHIASLPPSPLPLLLQIPPAPSSPCSQALYTCFPNLCA